MPFICLARTDISDGALQVKDLWPNISQRSELDPPGQGPVYANSPDNDAVAYTSNGNVRTMTGQYDGLAAYIADRVEGAAGAAFTAVQANAAAAAIIGQMQHPTNALTLTAVDGFLDAQVAGAGLTAGNSTGVLTELLQIVAGGLYRVPAGSEMQDAAGAFTTTTAGSFPEGTYRDVLDTDSLAISFAQGDLAALTSATYEHNGVAGNAISLFADDGTRYV